MHDPNVSAEKESSNRLEIPPDLRSEALGDRLAKASAFIQMATLHAQLHKNLDCEDDMKDLT